MNYEINWVPLDRRGESTAAKVLEVYEAYADKSEFSDCFVMYRHLNWGYLADPILFRGLIECRRLNKLMDAEQIQSLMPQPPDPPDDDQIHDDGGVAVQLPPTLQVSRSLEWFMAQAPNQKIKDEAWDQYLIRLLDLYMAHVSLTGETYYPSVAADLKAYAEFWG